MDKVSSRTSGDPEKIQDTSRSSVSSGSPVAVEDVDPALEKRIWRKLDLYILPVVTLFYLLSFLVSGNLPPTPM